MIRERNYELGIAPSAIRALYAYGLERKAQIGDDNVFDLSIGNPSVPSPHDIDECIERLGGESDGNTHGYTPSQGLPYVRKTIAENLNKRFGGAYDENMLYLTCGAAASLDICINAVTCPGEEVITITPYFPEYRVWIESAGAVCVEVPARQDNFQIDTEAVKAAITSKTAAIIINSPNNPVGVIYSRKTLEALAAVLTEKSAEFGHPIYLISDEPYRELAYSGEVSWVPPIYHDTLVCYSWSKSCSLPGERIGYVLVPPEVTDSRRVYMAVCGAGRALGFVCAPALWQHVIAACIDAPVDVSAYEENRKLLMDGLDKIGVEYIEPQGAFYLWIKAMEPDEQAFCDKAKDLELLIVPSTSFGVHGWARAGYCVAPEVITGSMSAFQKLYDLYH